MKRSTDSTVRVILLAGLLAGYSVATLAGCNDDKAKQQTDEQLTNLRRERDEYVRQLDKAREDLRLLRTTTDQKHTQDLAAAEQQRDEMGRRLDAIRDAVNAAMADDGRLAQLDPSDRDNVIKLTNELISRFAELRAEKQSLDLKYKTLQELAAGLEASLKRMATDTPPAATQSDRPDLLPR